MEAKVIRLESDFVLVELKSNGKQLPINLEDLSEEDVEFLNNYDADASGKLELDRSRRKTTCPKVNPKRAGSIRAPRRKSAPESVKSANRSGRKT